MAIASAGRSVQRLGMALLVGAALGAWHPPDVAGAEGAAPVQVLLFWGGGAPRAWDGTVEMPAGPDVPGIPWLWLMDHEEGDRFDPGSGWPEVRQSVPLALGLDPAEGGPQGTGPARIQGRTAGDADGVAFEWSGAREASLRVVLGEVRLECTLAELLRGPRQVPADDTGNVLLAKAIDLGRTEPPAVPAGGTRYHRTCLHTHSCASTSERPLAAEVSSLRPFVPRVWWTDHNHTSDRALLAGTFDSALAVQRYWSVASSGGAVVEAAGRVEEEGRGGVYRLRARALPGTRGAVTIHHPIGAGIGNLFTGLWLAPELAFDWRPPGEGAAFVELLTNTGRSLRYLSAPIPDGDPERDLVIPAAGGRWEHVRRNILADLQERWPEAAGDGLHHVRFGLVCAGSTANEATFDAFELFLPEPPERARALLEGYRSQEDAPLSHLGMEQSAWANQDAYGGLYPHLTFLMPGEDMAGILGFDHLASLAERGESIARCQAAGGVVGAHHLHQILSFDPLFEAPGWNLDLFEVGGAWLGVPAYGTEADRRGRQSHGYPPLERDEVYPLLVRWDRATARGLFLTGYGAPDLHEEFHRSSLGFFNRWLTDVIADGDRPEDLLAALRRGQAMGTEWHNEARLTLRVDGRAWMGRVLVTDREQVEVEAVVTGALPGSRLRWILGEFAAGADGNAPAVDPPPATVHGLVTLVEADSSVRTTVRPGAGRFLRAELLNPAGHLVAFSNPVGVVPFLPGDVRPERLALDWEGVVLDGALPEDRDRLQERTDLPRRPLRRIPPRKELFGAWDVGDPVEDELHRPEGFGPPLALGDARQMRKILETKATFTLRLPGGRESWLRLACRFPPALGGRVLVDGREVGSFAPRMEPTVRIPALEGSDRPRAVTVVLDQAPTTPLEQPNVEWVRVYVGEGVVDY